MLSEKEIRRDLEKTARQIVSRKTWPMMEAALFLGYSRQYIYMIVDKKGLFVIKAGGKCELYAIDILEIFEKNCGINFPDLADNWRKHHGIIHSPTKEKNQF